MWLSQFEIYFVEYLLVYGYITAFSFSKIEIKKYIVSYEVPPKGLIIYSHYHSIIKNDK